MKVALAQIESAPGDLKTNLRTHLEAIDQAIRNQADLIVFPELSLTGDNLGANAPDVSLPADDQILTQLLEASLKIDVVFGLIERGKHNLYNRYNSTFYFSEGTLLHCHRKLFLVNYAVFEEGKHYVPGNNLQAFDSNHGRAAIVICNDAWHAATPYIAALDGAELLIVPTASARGTLSNYLDLPQSWEHMNRAYSAMMGFFTIFVNRVGVRRDAHGEYLYWGGSEIIGPKGEVIVKAPFDEETIVYGEVEVERVARQRYRAPILRDARLWLVRQEINRLAAARSEEMARGALPGLETNDSTETIG